MRRSLPLLVVLLTGSTLGCANDVPTAPTARTISESMQSTMIPAEAILVTNAAELAGALSPANAGRRIVVRAGSYVMSQSLIVPDATTLEGEGVMQFDAAGRPTGFEDGTRTVISATASVTGNLLALGDGSAIRGLAIEDFPGRAGSTVSVTSRSAGDRISAEIDRVEILNRTPYSVGLQGPNGCSIIVLTQNPNQGSAPPPHVDAQVSARITRSLLRSPALGLGCGLFAFNFAPLANVSVALSDNIVSGGVIAAGGVSRGNSVYDSKTTITSHRNLYREGNGSPCTVRRTGWNIQGGAGAPIAVGVATTARNQLVMHSRDDRLEGFTTGILGSGGRQFFATAIAGATSDNTLDLQLIGTTIATASCADPRPSVDFRLGGALVTNASIVPGDGNTLRAVFRGVTASGVRANTYGDVLGPTGPQSAALSGSGNMLRFVGNPTAFAQTNSAIEPSPGAQFFTAKNW